jgi:ribonuclease HII
MPGPRKRSRYRCSYRMERKLFKQGYCRIAGVDEVGRGALCGPVVAAAVLFLGRPPIRGIDDSKRLTARRREHLKPKIIKRAISYGVGIVPAEEIDRINIHQASLKAMHIALSQLAPEPDFVLIDGRHVGGLTTPHLSVIKGDARCISIAAASIIAKVIRDCLMQSYATLYPDYDWSRNKGYSCKSHFLALEKFGPVSFHRKSFKPVTIDRQLSLS